MNLTEYNNFEIHITCDLPDLTGLKDIKTMFLYEELAIKHGWSTSMIDGDPLLGKGGRYYFTAHAEAEDLAYNRMESFAKILANNGIKIIRKKIEVIIYDTKGK